METAAAAAERERYFRSSQRDTLLPILWVGAGASAAAGLPALPALENALREDLGGSKAEGPALLDEYIEEFSESKLNTALERLLGKPVQPLALHEALVKLSGASFFTAFYTINYDTLLEQTLDAQRVPSARSTWSTTSSCKASRRC